MSDKFKVSEATSLLPFLSQKLQGWSRNNIKKRLQTSCVEVNGETTTKHDHALIIGDQVEVKAKASDQSATQRKTELEILHSDEDLIAINKPAGLLSVAAAKENKQHALALLRNQLSNSRKSIQLWPVHRLDRDTSGVLLFATSKQMREVVANSWTKAKKTYLAIVEGCPDNKQGTVDQPLRLDENEYRMHVGVHPHAKRAVTHYTIKRTAKKRTLLEVQLETGRQHQIRAHMAWLGHSLVGDERYGEKGPRMGLHALSLSITHPKTKKRLTFETPAPTDFLNLLK